MFASSHTVYSLVRAWVKWCNNVMSLPSRPLPPLFIFSFATLPLASVRPKTWTRRKVNLPHKRGAEAVTQYSLLCGSPTCPHLEELIQVVHLWGMRLKCSWLLLNCRMNGEALCVRVRRCVWCTSGTVCVQGGGLRFPSRPYWRWLLS